MLSVNQEPPITTIEACRLKARGDGYVSVHQPHQEAHRHPSATLGEVRVAPATRTAPVDQGTSDPNAAPAIFPAKYPGLFPPFLTKPRPSSYLHHCKLKEQTIDKVSTMAEVLWRHPNPTSTPMWRFLQKIREKYGLEEDTYESLYAWSVENVGDFWEECWDFVGIEASVGYVKASD